MTASFFLFNTHISVFLQWSVILKTVFPICRVGVGIIIDYLSHLPAHDLELLFRCPCSHGIV